MALARKNYALGRFEIVKEGTPLRFNGKAQQKPLAMLKALIALGGRNVSEFHIAEALWPDSDGDMQHQSLATTLYRLRQILGEKEMIEYIAKQFGFSNKIIVEMQNAVISLNELMIKTENIIKG